MDTDHFARSYSDALHYSDDPEEAFHQNLIYGDTNDRTGHLVYFDWLQDHGREKLAELLRRGFEQTGGRWGNGENGLDHGTPSGWRWGGMIGHLHLVLRRPRPSQLILAATPNHSWNEKAATEGTPFNYRVLLTDNEAHDLADSLPPDTQTDFRKVLRDNFKARDTRQKTE